MMWGETGQNHRATAQHPWIDQGEDVRLGPVSPLAAVLAGLLLVPTACGEDPPEGPLGKKSDTPGADASATPSQPSPPELPQATDDQAGQVAFAKWFTRAFAYSLVTNDSTILSDVGSTGKQKCTTCEDYADFLADRKASGIASTPMSYRVTKVFPTGKVGDVSVYTMMTVRSPYKNVDSSGRTIVSYPETKAYPIEVGLRYHQGAYELTGWSTGDKKQ
jgi:hypothetical protein